MEPCYIFLPLTDRWVSASASVNVNIDIHMILFGFAGVQPDSTTMFLYNLTLQRATGVTHAVHGSFSGTKQQEIVVARGKILELLRPDPNSGKVYTLLTTEIFGVIRSVIPFRLTGGSKGDLRIPQFSVLPSSQEFETLGITLYDTAS